ncbi:Na+/H+ antiporter subunit D [Natribacillus halophilus]|uniref:Multisubunit sodium/proton antiporter, MrpD subunit n=1 Tax=Natribacillus halophilus TaxID=549003 RepID=A0A1G8QFQ7_9BACI|nr:Na+/H+ antiporter subunit D [Natribacillus halophilus]SDJ03468.1 multisubunit sodium/proton antiporter, MrpD subunit [Natribacillus halophilus]
MNNLVILPIVIPLLAGVALIFFRKQIRVQRYVTTLSLLLLAVVTMVLIQQVSDAGTQTLNLGGWDPPFGIVLVADMFALLLMLATVIVAFCCVLYGFRTIGEAREKHYLYPFIHFLLVGVMGSFLTGDLFNLFVFFEVMLLASYILVSLGGTKDQLRESLKYVLINIVSSMFFLVAIGYLYAITGTLNFADLSMRIAETGQDGLITTVAIFLLLVFAIKAALLMYFWLPGAYVVPPMAISAMFAALLTKVGIYAIFRTFTLIFYHEPAVTHQLIAWLGILTMIFGAIGAVAYWDVRKILAYNVVIAVGFIFAGLAVFTEVALAGSIYYLMHDMVVKALLFLLGGVMIGLTGTDQLRKMSGMIRNHAALGWMFFLAALALAGIPPLSGFIGKLLILQGAIGEGFYILAAVGLVTSLMVLYSVMKIFMNGFWGENQLSVEDERMSTRGLLFPCAILATITVGLGLGVEWVNVYALQAAEVLNNPQLYIEAVLPNAD